MSDSDLDYLVSLIFKTKRRIMENIRDSEKIDPFSYLRLEVLRFIKNKPSCSMKDIADFLFITPPSVTSLVNSLVKKGVIKRIRDKKDRRIIRLVLTSKGLEELKKGFFKIEEKIKKMYSRLSRQEVRQLIKILNKFSKEFK